VHIIHFAQVVNIHFHLITQICIGNYDYLDLSWVGGKIIIGLWGCIFELRNAQGGVLNFEIVLSIGSSAGYGRISQQEEILYGFYLFYYSLVLQGTHTVLAKHESIH
jgi:hypothetical protein